jgi:pyrimidine-nucleoside phosphorylase
MRAYNIILKKRNKKALSLEELKFMIQGNIDGQIPDYQMSALLMAIFLNGMDKKETSFLTKAMIESGDEIDLSSINGIKVDKHSTGGVGDKTSIVLAPLVASLGVKVPKISGRGLGHTGGTIDKLESIPGFSVDMTEKEFINNVNHIGLAIGGQTKNLVPADKKLYALRDVTATVDNISLIAASIMSKKLVSGADAILLDVKTGSGSFTPIKEDAFSLAKEMIDIGDLMGRNTVAVVTNMDEPLGNAIGNALELKESIETLQGKGPDDLRELCIELGTEMLILSGKYDKREDAVDELINALDNGLAWNKFREFVKIQGGDLSYIDEPEKLPLSPLTKDIVAVNEGYIHELTAREIGEVSLTLGAGRKVKEDKIDHGSGIILYKKVGDKVSKGEKIASLYSESEEMLNKASDKLERSIKVGNEFVPPNKLIHGIVKKESIIH